MLIDWFTVGAQMLNLLILVWLLKRFLYKPILNAIDARENRIAAELANAASTRTAAEVERVEFQSKRTALDEQRSALLGKAADEAKAEHVRLFAEVHQEADALRAKYGSAMRNDQMRLGREISRMAQEEIFGIARKALADLAEANLEERMGAVFMRRLKEMDGKAKESLSATLKTSSETAVRSAFDMPATQRAAIQNALNETFSADVRIRFETSPNTICGIELAIGEQKLAWSIAEYLASLENKVNSLMDAQAMPAAQDASNANAALVTRIP